MATDTVDIPDEVDESAESPLLEGQDVSEDLEPEGIPAPGDGVEEPSGEQAPPAPSFIDSVSELGFQDVSDESQAQQRVLDAYRQQQYAIEQLQQQAQQSQQLAQYGNQFLEMQRDPDFLAWQNQRSKPPEEGEAPAGGSWWQAPDISYQTIERYREQDQTTGQWKWKSGTPAKIRTDWEDREAYISNWAEQLTTEPHKVLPPIIEQIVENKLAQRLNEHVSEQREEQFAEQVMSANASWLYQSDPRTGQVAMDVNGRPIPSPGGRTVMNYVNHAAQIGIDNPREQWNYAISMTQLGLVQQQGLLQQNQQQAPDPNSGTNGRRKRHSALNRGGTRTPAEQPNSVPQNPNLTGGEQLAQSLENEGFFVAQ